MTRVAAPPAERAPSHHFVGRERAGEIGIGFDLHRRVPDGEAAIEVDAEIVKKGVAGGPPGMTRWQVSAVSVVLIGQMCRSWTEVTPGRAARKARTSVGSMWRGAAAIAISNNSLSRPQVPQTIAALTARLTSGSSHSQPVTRTARPAATTPTETTASAAMWR